MKTVFLIAFIIILIRASAAAPELSFGGNLEAQGRLSWNNEEAKKELFQNWDKEEFGLLFGNLNANAQFKKWKVESNGFFRQSESDLYRNNYFAAQIYTFPNRLVARDLFGLQHVHQTDESKSEAVLNKAYVEGNLGAHRLGLGRMYINYGQGEVFNPINPFNQPTGLTSIGQVAQGNDGASFRYFIKDDHSFDLFLLGDKRFHDDDGKISTTVWGHGSLSATEKLSLDYVLGQDQERRKIGGQSSYQFADALAYLQVLYQTKLVTDDPSHQLIDIAFGYDEQLTNLWHLRLETGYQKKNRFSTLSSLTERFLPIETFLALVNVYEVHPLVKLSGTVITDVRTGFTYVVARGTYSISENTEAELFGFTPAAQGGSTDEIAQKLVTRDIGLSLRGFF